MAQLAVMIDTGDADILEREALKLLGGLGNAGPASGQGV
jgi:hypothetical protein